MTVELTGTLRMSGESGAGTRVHVDFEGDRLRLSSGGAQIGDWSVHEIGIHALQEGFSIRAEGEEFVLVTDDDAALAEAMDLKTASPRLARQVAARHRPDEPSPPPEPELIPTKVGPMALAVSGVLVLSGAISLRSAVTRMRVAPEQVELIPGSGIEFWAVFAVGGVLTVAVAYAMSIDANWSRPTAFSIVVGLIIVFGLAVSDTPTDVSHLIAFALLAGGLALGVGVLFSGSLEDRS